MSANGIMLPLRSSMMTTVIGWTSFEKTEISWRWPLSKTKNASFVRSVRRRPEVLSVTVA